MEKERLFNEFQPVTSEDWKNKIIEDLKGADYEKKMIWRTTEGFDVNPFYRKEDLPAGCENEVPGKYPFTRGNKADNNWLVRQELNIADAAKANAKAKKIIADGVESIAFRVKGKWVTPEYIPTLLNGIDAEKVELNFNVCLSKVVEFTTLLIEYYRQRGFDLEKVCGSINYDPIEKEMFAGKALYDATGAFAVRMQKGGAKNEHQVDAITGGTKTCDGVNAMLETSIQKYESFLCGAEAEVEADTAAAEECTCGECCEEEIVEPINEEE